MLVERRNTNNRISFGNAERRFINHPSVLITAEPNKDRRHAEFYDVMDASLAINTPEQFCAWAQGDLQHIFPHGMLVAGIGLIENETAQINQFVTSNFPHEYLKTLKDLGGLNTSPVLVHWIRTRQPVLFEMAVHNCQSPWLENVARHNLLNMAAHGQCDVNSRATSYFSFSQIPAVLTSRHAKLLHLLVPHMHMALIRALSGVKKTSRTLKPALPELTEREHEILQWLGSGKTNWEIAQVLGLSEYTVKNHVQRILLKLKVKNRAQAVAKILVPA